MLIAVIVSGTFIKFSSSSASSSNGFTVKTTWRPNPKPDSSKKEGPEADGAGKVGKLEYNPTHQNKWNYLGEHWRREVVRQSEF